jgi:ribosome-associated protein
MLEVTHRIRIPLSEFSWSYARSGGPGGQNVNKVASKAILRWPFEATTSVPPDIKTRFRASFGNRLTLEGDLVLSSELTRDQGRNREDCLEKLSAMLKSVAVPPKVRRPTKPTRGSQLRRLDAKKKQSNTKSGRQAPRDD